MKYDFKIKHEGQDWEETPVTFSLVFNDRSIAVAIAKNLATTHNKEVRLNEDGSFNGTYYRPEIPLQFTDKNGNDLSVDDHVLVPEPDDTDVHNHEFAGTIEQFDNGYAMVRDGDGNYFSIEPERLALLDDLGQEV